MHHMRCMRVTIVCARDTCVRGLIYNNVCVDGTCIHAWNRPQDPAGGVPFGAERVAFAACGHRDWDTRRSVSLSLSVCCLSVCPTNAQTHTPQAIRSQLMFKLRQRECRCVCVCIFIQKRACVHICVAGACLPTDMHTIRTLYTSLSGFLQDAPRTPSDWERLLEAERQAAFA